MIEDLLTELSASGWTISWAFQFSLGHWRMSIIQEIDVGEEQGTYLSFCPDAPTFAEALEDCLSRRADAEFKASQPITFSNEPKSSGGSLLSALGLHLRPATSPIRRRV